MAVFFAGAFLFLIGAFMTAAEIPACEYERNGIGPWVSVVGILVAIGAIADAII